jgi:hypothetical protein
MTGTPAGVGTTARGQTCLCEIEGLSDASVTFEALAKGRHQLLGIIVLRRIKKIASASPASTTSPQFHPSLCDSARDL